ncbi:S-layer homology domain-containing protein [Demequina sp. NBRC 110056]|uniref:CAP and S-layer homology domain-containing protein n=1 Tax=Demequina sp. NBRC 110056 TaxID=1570345 RepID=UPI0009FC943F|nr:S-layer homology domain-containing protein [Demequina sp. NBRC 110056]
MATERRSRAAWRVVAATAGAIVAAVAIGPAAGAGSGATDTGAAVILSVTNDYRKSAGAAALTRAGLIDDVAQAWAVKMRSSKSLSHNPSYSAQMPRTGMSAAAENVAYACGYGGAKANAERIMRNWYNSSGHRANMLNKRYTHIGIGYAYDTSSDCGYAVQNFGDYAQEYFDVPLRHQFYDEIDWLSGEGITTGYADGTFRPKDDVSREAFAAFLYRLAGSPKVSTPARSPFKDVPTSAQFYKQIVWLSQEGISTGWSDGTFRPKDEITREAMAAFLYRYYGNPSTSKSSAASKFSDINRGSNFLTEISWLASSGITTGYSDGTFRPGATVTREATAAFLERAEG